MPNAQMVPGLCSGTYEWIAKWMTSACHRVPRLTSLLTQLQAIWEDLHQRRPETPATMSIIPKKYCRGSGMP